MLVGGCDSSTPFFSSERECVVVLVRYINTPFSASEWSVPCSSDSAPLSHCMPQHSNSHHYRHPIHHCSGRQADFSDKARRLSSVYVLPFINLHGLNRDRESHGDEDAPLSFYNVALFDRWVIIKFIHNNQPKRSESTRRSIGFLQKI